MKGIVTNSQGEISIVRGALEVGDNRADVAERVLATVSGDVKEYPRLGLFVQRVIGGVALPPFWMGRAKTQLRSEGIEVEKLNIASDGNIELKIK